MSKKPLIKPKLAVALLSNMSIGVSNAVVSSKMSAVSCAKECVIWSWKSVVPYITFVFVLILGFLSLNRNKVYLSKSRLDQKFEQHNSRNTYSSNNRNTILTQT